MQVARLLTILLTSAMTSLAYAETWMSVRGESELEFIANYEGADAPGQFSRFEVVVKTDPESSNPDSLTVSVDITSASMGNEDIDEAIGEPEWFDARTFPRATFRSTQVQAADQPEYTAEGVVSIKGVEQPIIIPFDWNTDGDRAEMAGSLDLSRLNFGIGTGEWASESPIGHTVQLRFSIELRTE
jgi:polyisoprenoid-binding protein YceI